MSGMFTAAGSDLNRAYLIEDLGRRFELPLVGYKRYPTGGPAQAGVEGILQLSQRVDRRQIDRVRIAMPERADAFANAAMPALNLPYLCAIIIIDGSLDFSAAHSMARKETDPRCARSCRASRSFTIRRRSAAAWNRRGHGDLRRPAARVFIEVAGFPSHPMTRGRRGQGARAMTRGWELRGGPDRLARPFARASAMWQRTDRDGEECAACRVPVKANSPPAASAALIPGVLTDRDFVVRRNALRLLKISACERFT